MQKLNLLIDQNKSLEQSLCSLKQEFREKIEDLEEKLSYANDQVSKLKFVNDNLSFKINSITQGKLINFLSISGIPKENNENIKEIVLKLGQAVGSEVNADDIENCYRKPVKTKNGLSYPIIVEMKNQKPKIDFLSKCKIHHKTEAGLSTTLIKPGAERRSVYVGHHLTKQSQFLLARAKEQLKTKHLKFVWVHHTGDVMVKRAEGQPTIKIINLSHLSRIIKNG